MATASTDLEYLLLKYPNALWDWKRLSQNSAISFEFIKSHLDKPWRWDKLCAHPQVPLCFIEKHDPYLRREWFRVRPDVDLAFIKKYSDNISDMNWFEISRSSRISMSDIVSNLELPWSPPSIWKNPNITLSVAEMFQEHISSQRWFWENLSCGIDMDTVRLNIDKPWNWQTICRNPHMNLTMYLEHLEKFPSGRETTFATLEDIKAHPEIEWEKKLWYYSNPHLSDEWLDPTKFNSTLLNRSLVENLSERVSMKTIENMPLPWSFGFISSNRNLTATFVEQNIEQFANHWYKISENTFDGPNRLPFVSESRKAMLDELMIWSDSPPDPTEHRAIFQKGGSRYHENWLDVKESLSSSMVGETALC